VITSHKDCCSEYRVHAARKEKKPEGEEFLVMLCGFGVVALLFVDFADSRAESILSLLICKMWQSCDDI
jgi:hypothetical protein